MREKRRAVYRRRQTFQLHGLQRLSYANAASGLVVYKAFDIFMPKAVCANFQRR